MRKDLIIKFLVLGVICLFIGVGIQPAFAVDIPEKEEIESKDYLFETIVAITNNPDVQDLLEENNPNIINLDYNYKYVYRQLLFKNPELLLSLIFTKPKMTTEYLDKIYNQGIEIIDIIGEEKADEMLDSIEISNSDIFNDIHNIVTKNKELSYRISILEELNEENNEICAILSLLLIISLIQWSTLVSLYYIFEDFLLLLFCIGFRAMFLTGRLSIITFLFDKYDCWWI